MTKSKFDNKTAWHSLVDGLNRATDVLIEGRRCLRLRRCRQGLCRSTARPGSPGDRHRVDLIQPCRRLWTDSRSPPWTTWSRLRHLRHRHGCGTDHQPDEPDEAPGDRSNIGHTDNEIDMAGLRAHVTMINIAAGRRVAVRRLDGRGPRSIIVLMRLADEPGTRLTSKLRDEQLVHQPGAGPDRVAAEGPSPAAGRRVHNRTPRYYTLPKHLDETVARLHLTRCVRLTEPRRSRRSIWASRSLDRTSRTTIATDSRIATSAGFRPARRPS